MSPNLNLNSAFLSALLNLWLPMLPPPQQITKLLVILLQFPIIWRYQLLMKGPLRLAGKVETTCYPTCKKKMLGSLNGRRDLHQGYQYSWKHTTLLQAVLTTALPTPKHANTLGVSREREVRLASALPMVEDAGAKKMAVQKEPKVVLFTARPMAGAAAASILGALSLPRDVLTFVLHMAGAADATMRAARVLPEEGRASAFAMAVANGAHTLCAPSPLKATLVFALPTVEVVAVSTRNVQRAPKEAPISAKPMEAEKGAPIQGVQRALRGVPLFAKATAAVRGVLSLVAAARVYMVGPSSVLPMEAASVVQWLTAPNLQGGGQIFAYDTGVGSAARLMVAVRVPKEAPTSARHTVEEKDADGVKLVPGLVNQVNHVRGSQGAKLVFAQRTQPCWTTQGFMAVIQLVLLFPVTPL